MWTHAVLLSFILIVQDQVKCQDPRLTLGATNPEGTAGTRASETFRYIVALKGQAVSMECNVDYLPLRSSVIWQFQKNVNSSILPISRNLAVDDNTRYAIDTPKSTTWRLIIKSMEENWSGFYTCLVQLNKNSRLEGRVQIVVHKKPEIDNEKTSSNKIEVEEGKAIDLMCNAEGIPKPVIIWTRMGRNVLPTGAEEYIGNRISIESAKSADSGYYYCIAENSIGSQRRTIHLIVHHKAFLTPLVTDVKQALNYRIELVCDIDASPAPADDMIVWYHQRDPTDADPNPQRMPVVDDDKRVFVKITKSAFNMRRAEIIITRVEQSDYGTYYLTVDSMGGRNEKTMRLTWIAEPQPSLKLGRVISGASQCISTLSLLMMVSSLTTLLILTRWQH